EWKKEDACPGYYQRLPGPKLDNDINSKAFFTRSLISSTSGNTSGEDGSISSTKTSLLAWGVTRGIELIYVKQARLTAMRTMNPAILTLFFLILTIIIL